MISAEHSLTAQRLVRCFGLSGALFLTGKLVEYVTGLLRLVRRPIGETVKSPSFKPTSAYP
jgi:hypothetical protein